MSKIPNLIETDQGVWKEYVIEFHTPCSRLLGMIKAILSQQSSIFSLSKCAVECPVHGPVPLRTVPPVHQLTVHHGASQADEAVMG